MKEKYLMHRCCDWGEESCHPEVNKHKHPKELKEGEEILLWPSGEEQKKLDEICKKCEYRFFEIEKSECPVCGKTPLATPISPDFLLPSSVIEKAMPERFNYKCVNCGTYLYAYKEL